MSESENVTKLLLTPKEASEYLAISVPHLKDLTDDGSLRWVNIGRGSKRATRRYTKEDLDDFIQSRSTRTQVLRRITPKLTVNPAAQYKIQTFEEIRQELKAKKELLRNDRARRR